MPEDPVPEAILMPELLLGARMSLCCPRRSGPLLDGRIDPGHVQREDLAVWSHLGSTSYTLTDIVGRC